MPDTQQLGYVDNYLWIRFQGEIISFPKDVLLTPCALRYLEEHNWTYDGANGCGTTLASRTLLRIAEAVFNVDFSTVCNIHDLEYSIPPADNCGKSYRHKISVDSHLEYNALLTIQASGKEATNGAKLLAFMYMVAVRLFGRKSYWDDVPVNNSF